MRKNIITATTVLFLVVLFIISASCSQTSNKKEEPNSDSFKEAMSEQQNISGEEWLNSIFLCDNGSGYCFPDEEKVTTERYYEFFIESVGMYDYPMFETENERIAAEKVYKDKWKDIYPLSEEVSYPFGRGNGTESGQKLENVIVTSHSDSNYTVHINYGGKIESVTEVRIVPNGDSYLVDYMKSEYVQ